MASRLLSFDLAGIAPETGAPPPDRVLSGSPRFLTWNLDEAGGGLFAGVWEASPGAWRIAYEEWEFCHILAGISIITEDGGAGTWTSIIEETCDGSDNQKWNVPDTPVTASVGDYQETTGR